MAWGRNRGEKMGGGFAAAHFLPSPSVILRSFRPQEEICSVPSVQFIILSLPNNSGRITIHIGIIQEFGKTKYKQMAYINFERPNAPKNLFEIDFDTDRIITVLNAYCNLKITAEDTLIVFDEIQAAPKGIKSHSYFINQL